MPRFRFTVRGMMVAVAVVALLCGVELMWRRYASFRGLAARHAEGAADWAAKAARDAAFAEKVQAEALATNTEAAGPLAYRQARASDWAGYVATPRRMAAYHGALAHKYERAARYPWLPVAPDPPEPE